MNTQVPEEENNEKLWLRSWSGRGRQTHGLQTRTSLRPIRTGLCRRSYPGLGPAVLKSGRKNHLGFRHRPMRPTGAPLRRTGSKSQKLGSERNPPPGEKAPLHGHHDRAVPAPDVQSVHRKRLFSWTNVPKRNKNEQNLQCSSKLYHSREKNLLISLLQTGALIFYSHAAFKDPKRLRKTETSLLWQLKLFYCRKDTRRE